MWWKQEKMQMINVLLPMLAFGCNYSKHMHTSLVEITDGKEFVQEIKITSDPDFPTAMLQEELEIETAKQRQEVIE